MTLPRLIYWFSAWSASILLFGLISGKSLNKSLAVQFTIPLSAISFDTSVVE